MTCSDAVRLIGHAAEGHAAPTALDALLQHLDRCEACRAEAENQVLVKRLLASRPEEPLPGGLAAAISRRLDLEGSRATPTVDWRRLTIRLLPAAAALGLAAGLVHRAGFGDHRDSSSVVAVWHQYWYGGQTQISDPKVSDAQVLALLLLGDRAGPDEGER
jgi:anti-sigma factor RsiW